MFVILILTIIAHLWVIFAILRVSRIAENKNVWYLFAISNAVLALRTGFLLKQHLVDGLPIGLFVEGTHLAAVILFLVGVVPFRTILASRLSLINAHQNLLGSMRDTFYRANAKGEIEYVSASAESLLGYTPDELVGAQLSDYYENPQDREKLIEALFDNNDEVEAFRSWAHHKNGQRVALDIDARVLRDANGDFLAVEGIVRNVTERIKTEAQNMELGRIVEGAPAEILVFDAETLAFVIVNLAARNNLGYAMSELQAMIFTDLEPADSAINIDRLLVSLARGEETVIKFENLIRRKDGTEYPIEVFLQYSRTQLRPVFFAIAYDITERRKAEESLDRSRRMHSLGQLTGGVAHDFNNMLQVMQMNLEKLRPINPDYMKWYHGAEKVVEQSAQLTERLLAFARRQTLLPRVFDVNFVLGDMQSLMSLTLTAAVKLDLSLSADELKVEVDEGQIENALLNLLLNARDAMPAGGTLRLRVAKVRLGASEAFRMDELEGGDYVEISIGDNGQGMSAEVLRNAIEPFYTTKTAVGGTGLGLSMVYGFAKQSGGHLSMESEVGVGTTARLYFPLSHKSLSVVSEALVAGAVSLIHGEAILLIEDDPVLRELISGSLSDVGYRIVTAIDGDQAAQIISQSNGGIRLVIADVLLAGGETGPEVVRRIKTLQAELATIFISGHTREYWGDTHGFPDDAVFLRKPFKLRQLQTIIDQLVCQ
jgi:PAS domain S-box-containing protein